MCAKYTQQLFCELTMDSIISIYEIIVWKDETIQTPRKFAFKCKISPIITFYIANFV